MFLSRMDAYDPDPTIVILWDVVFALPPAPPLPPALLPPTPLALPPVPLLPLLTAVLLPQPCVPATASKPSSGIKRRIFDVVIGFLSIGMLTRRGTSPLERAQRQHPSGPDPAIVTCPPKEALTFG
jgi:hypothetical protein